MGSPAITGRWRTDVGGRIHLDSGSVYRRPNPVIFPVGGSIFRSGFVERNRAAVKIEKRFTGRQRRFVRTASKQVVVLVVYQPR